MDFIERFLHLSPDAGNGSVEGTIIAFLVLLVALLVFRKSVWTAIRRFKRRDE
jgi:hypothetical protein